MSRNELKDTAPKPAAKRSLFRQVSRIARLFARIVLSPVRLFLSVRRSMTAASVSLLLIGIVTVNIVWGYPWTGMFSACASMLFVGWTINRIMRPNLQLGFTLPNSSAADQPFSVVTHLKNRSRLPAMDLGVGFDAAPRQDRGSHRAANAPAGCRSLTSRQSLSLIRPAERRDLHATMVSDRRGIHSLPDVIVTSMFPFHLFQSSRRYASETCIAITPRLMTGEEDAVCRGLLNTLGGWSRRLLSGDALDYTGSREYEVGMSVRRWDFASWARLGRPIVQEFQSPSIQMVMLIVDTSVSDAIAPSDSHDESPMERVLSLAATAVTELTRKMVSVRLYVTCESPSLASGIGLTPSPSDVESLLIRLAGAESVSPLDADQRQQEVLEQVGHFPVLVLTARLDSQLQQQLSPNITILRVRPQRNTSPRAKKRKRWKGRKRALADSV